MSDPDITPWSGYRRLYRNGQTAARVTPDIWRSGWWIWSSWTATGLLIESGGEPAHSLAEDAADRSLYLAPAEPTEVR